MSKVLLGLQLLIALSALRHEGRRVPAGKPVALTPEQAKAVIDCGAARVATEEEAAMFTAGTLDEVGADTSASASTSASTSADADADANASGGGDDGAAASAVAVAAAPPPAATKAPTKKPAASKPAAKSARKKA
ncbi:hypothetical protein [Variovorax boronicumulans]